MNLKQVPSMFTHIDRLRFDETVDLIEQRIENRQKTQHVVINAGKVVLMSKKSGIGQCSKQLLSLRLLRMIL